MANSTRDIQIDSALPLCVGLDNVLVRTNTLHEQVLLLRKQPPLAVAAVLSALFFRGIAAFRHELARRVALRADLLPYNEKLLSYLQRESARGRRIILVTAADRIVAEAIAKHLGIFETVLAPDDAAGLDSRRRAEEITGYLGNGGFIYAGSSRSEGAIWDAASAVVAVNPTFWARRAMRHAGLRVVAEFNDGFAPGDAIRAIRAYQWLKNLLVFIPAFLSHNILNISKIVPGVIAFAALSATASAIYIFNDIFDLEADRQHPRKRRRPFASGSIPIAHGVLMALVLLGVALALSYKLPAAAKALILLYAVASALYTIRLKSLLFVDVVILSGLYTLRILFGGAASSIVISPWALAFSMFIFTSLAICKRLSELRSREVEKPILLPGRAYSQTDIVPLTALACSSGYLAMVVLALYLNSPEVLLLYRNPKIMWLLLPVLMYWIGRAIMLSNRGAMHDDPILFAIGDVPSWLVFFMTLGVVIAAI